MTAVVFNQSIARLSNYARPVELEDGAIDLEPDFPQTFAGMTASFRILNRNGGVEHVNNVMSRFSEEMVSLKRSEEDFSEFEFTGVNGSSARAKELRFPTHVVGTLFGRYVGIRVNRPEMPHKKGLFRLTKIGRGVIGKRKRRKGGKGKGGKKQKTK